MLSGFERAVRYAGRATLDLLLPPQCLTCDQPVDAPGRFCAACFSRTSFISEPCCTRCGLPFGASALGGLDQVCERCRVEPPGWSQARAALVYDDQAKRILLPFKHGDRVETARALAPIMARAGAALLRSADLLVPVPLHRRRLFSRRYNQAALLARELARLAGRRAVLDGLVRVRMTRPLGAMSAAKRQAELAGAFAVRPSRRAIIADARVVLVDDVLTSGATAEACSRALLDAGAGCVDVLAAARVPDPRANE